MTTTDRVPFPEDGDERSIALATLAYHRDAVATKCRGLTPDQFARRSAEPSVMSLMGLLRHLCEMERVCGWWPLGEDPHFDWVWGSYDDGAEPDFDCGPDEAQETWSTWERERARTDRAIAARPDMDQVCGANGRSVRWNLAKLNGEYARHAGHADLLRERIDGLTGE